MTVSNLVVVFGIIVFYMFMMWGVDSLYETETDDLITNPAELEETTLVTMFQRVFEFAYMIFEISLFKDPRIPDIVTALIITPLNFLLFGSLIYLIRGAGV